MINQAMMWVAVSMMLLVMALCCSGAKAHPGGTSETNCGHVDSSTGIWHPHYTEKCPDPATKITPPPLPPIGTKVDEVVVHIKKDENGNWIYTNYSKEE